MNKSQKKPRILLPNEKKFADLVIATDRLKDSAAAVYPHLSNPSTKAGQLMNKDVVREYIQSQAMGAAERITKIAMKSKNLGVKLNANKDILDRAGYKPQEAQVNINMPLYLPLEIMEKYGLNPKEEINGSTN